jgi:hypothetical protein
MYTLMIALNCGGSAQIETENMERLQEFASLVEAWQSNQIDEEPVIPVFGEE